MSLISLLCLSFAVLVGYATFRLFKRNELSLEFFLFWELSGLTLFLVGLFPDFFRSMVGKFYSGLLMDLLFFLAILGLFLIGIRLSVEMKRLNKRLEKLARAIALDRAEREDSALKGVLNESP